MVLIKGTKSKDSGKSKALDNYRKDMEARKATRISDSMKIENSIDNRHLSELEEMLRDEMYANSETRLFNFYQNFWSCHDPADLHVSWVQECVAEHVQAALNRDIRRLIVAVPPRCLPITTQVLMADGSYKQLKDMKLGDYVKSSDGKEITNERVTAVIESGVKNCIKFTFNDGSSLTTSKEHKIYTPNGFIQAQKLSLQDVVYTHINQKNINPTSIALDDAFLLGCWIAEGTKGNRSAFCITNQTPVIVNKLKNICSSKGWIYAPSSIQPELRHRWTNSLDLKKGTGIKGGIRKWFDTYIGDTHSNICYNTQVPDIIWTSTDEVKIEFLNAFIACDGWIDTHSGKIGTEVSSKQLALDISRLFKQLGFHTTLKTRPARGEFLTPQGFTCIAREHYSCSISRKSNLDKAKNIFNFYHKQDKLLAIDSKNIQRDADIPLKEIELYTTAPNWLIKEKRQFIGIDRLSKDFNKLSRQAIEPLLDKYENNIRWKSITSIEEVGSLECMDLTVSNHHTFFADDVLLSNSGKSVMSISSICWHWLNSPWEKFWLVSHSARLFVQNIVLTRRIMEHPLYQSRWMDPTGEHYRFGLSKDVNTKTKVENDQGGYILGGSPTSGALGMGYSVAFLDDVLDSEQANSPDAINKVNNWYTQTFLNRSNDVRNDVQIIFMQRLNQNDIINYVNTKYGDQGWFNLVLPAKYDPKRIFFSPIGFNDPRKMKNELLDPVRLPDEFLQAQAKNQLIYNTRYQQDPVGDDQGNLIQKEWLREVDVLPKTYDQMMTVWDLSFGDSPKSSYSVGLVLGTKGDDFYVIDMIRERMAVPEQVDAIRKLRDKYPRSQIGIEKRANGNAAISLLQREITNIYAFQPRLYGGSKEQRLSSILSYMRDGKFHIYSPFDVDIRTESTYDSKEIIDELKAFPLGTNDDIVDCIAYGIQWLAQNGRESTAIITGGKQIIIAELDKVSDTYLRDRSTSEDRLNSFEFDMFDGDWSRDDIIGLNF